MKTGISVEGGSDNRIEGNHIIGATDHGIRIRNSPGTTAAGNRIESSELERAVADHDQRGTLRALGIPDALSPKAVGQALATHVTDPSPDRDTKLAQALGAVTNLTTLSAGVVAIANRQPDLWQRLLSLLLG